MKNKIVTVIYIMIICITLKIVYNHLINAILINRYNNGEYSVSRAKALTYFNIFQPYVANYNYGNILFQNGEYENAIEKYKEALKGIVPKYKECKIRINYALAICKTVNVDESNQESIGEAINTYELAIDILTVDGCASKNGELGHNKEAEQLKNDIQKEIDRLKKLRNTDNNEDDRNRDNNDSKDKDDTIESKIQDIKKEAINEQREVENQYKNQDYDYSGTEKIW